MKIMADLIDNDKKVQLTFVKGLLKYGKILETSDFGDKLSR